MSVNIGNGPRTASPRERVHVLCVDDEPHVIDGVALQLRRGFDVVGATSGDAGLAALRERGPFAVVMSDMRMPGMDGAAFLAKAREVAPDATRLLLTGHADFSAAIAAVNRGGIFRFLTKPCSPEDLRLAFDEAAEQHRLVTAERVLLEETLRGSVKTLVDLLALTSPLVFGRASRIRQSATELAESLSLTDRWALEVAAMLSQLGAIGVPDAILSKEQSGEPLSTAEQEMMARAAEATDRLLAQIPRLEPVRAIVSLSAARSLGDVRSAPRIEAAVLLGAEILKLATDLESLEARGEAPQRALDLLSARGARYDARVLKALRALKGSASSRATIREVAVRRLIEGMVFAEDVRTPAGVLLVARGFEVTASFLERVRNFGPGYVREPVRVVMRDATGPGESLRTLTSGTSTTDGGER